MRRLWLTTALLLWTASAPAEEKTFVAIHGFDKMSCQDWFGSEGNPDVRQQYITWIRGVITGYNYANPGDQVGTGRMPSDFGLGVFVDNYCHSKRATSISGAAFALIAERRGSTTVQVLDDAPKPAASNVGNTSSGGGNAGGAKAGATTVKDAAPADPPGFRDWLARQSSDMKSLDINILRNIYKRESALPDKQ